MVLKKWIILALCAVIALGIISCNSAGSDPAISSAEKFNLAENYDMEGPEGAKVLTTDHFRLQLPGDLEQYELGVDQPQYTELEFYYWPSLRDGLESTLFTLYAFDESDSSYKDLDNYVEVGTGESKRYIAVFGSDDAVQGTKHETRFAELLEFFQDLRPDSGDSDFISFTK